MKNLIIILVVLLSSCGGSSNVFRKESPWPFGSRDNKSQAIEYRKYHDRHTTFKGWYVIEKNAEKEKKWREKEDKKVKRMKY